MGYYKERLIAELDQQDPSTLRPDPVPPTDGPPDEWFCRECADVFPRAELIAFDEETGKGWCRICAGDLKMITPLTDAESQQLQDEGFAQVEISPEYLDFERYPTGFGREDRTERIWTERAHRGAGWHVTVQHIDDDGESYYEATRDGFPTLQDAMVWLRHDRDRVRAQADAAGIMARTELS